MTRYDQYGNIIREEPTPNNTQFTNSGEIIHHQQTNNPTPTRAQNNSTGLVLGISISGFLGIVAIGIVLIICIAISLNSSTNLQKSNQTGQNDTSNITNGSINNDNSVIPSPRPSYTSTPVETKVFYPTATRVPFRSYSAINDCAQARVMLGDIVVLENDVDDLFIRSSSDNHPSNNIISHFKPGQRAKIVSGPECSWGWMMWKIQRLDDGFEGWVAESNGKEFWLKLAE